MKKSRCRYNPTESPVIHDRPILPHKIFVFVIDYCVLTATLFYFCANLQVQELLKMDYPLKIIKTQNLLKLPAFNSRLFHLIFFSITPF